MKWRWGETMKSPRMVLLIKRLIPFIVFALLVIFERASFSELEEPIRFSDTKVFERVSHQDVTSSKFYTNGRPFFTPLVYKVLNRDTDNVFVFESAVSVLCWFLFAAAVSEQFRNRVIRYVVLITLCCFSLTIPVNQWDAILLSESLSISITLLAICLSVVLVRKIGSGYTGPRDWGIFSAWGLTCFFLVGTRDSNAYTLWLIFLAFVIWATVEAFSRLKARASLKEFMKQRRLLWGALVVVVVLAMFSNWSLKNSVRWQTPLLNVMLIRVLANNDKYDHWVSKYHMPDNPDFKKRRGKKAWDRYDKKTKIRDEMRREGSRLEDIYEWIVSRGMSSYKSYLLRDNVFGAIEDAVEAFSKEVNSENDAYGKGVAGVTGWTRALTDRLFMDISNPTAVFLVILFWSSLSLVFHRDSRLAASIVLFTLGLTFIQSFVGYHGDAAEVSRHMMMVGIFFRVSLIIWVGLAVADIQSFSVVVRHRIWKRQS